MMDAVLVVFLRQQRGGRCQQDGGCEAGET
jgi:hypothetical protein